MWRRLDLLDATPQLTLTRDELLHKQRPLIVCKKMFNHEVLSRNSQVGNFDFLLLLHGIACYVWWLGRRSMTSYINGVRCNDSFHGEK
jgi:hypothetical protein